MDRQRPKDICTACIHWPRPTHNHPSSRFTYNPSKTQEIHIPHLEPLTPWQLLALATLIHALISGMWVGFLAFCLTANPRDRWSVEISGESDGVRMRVVAPGTNGDTNPPPPVSSTKSTGNLPVTYHLPKQKRCSNSPDLTHF